MSPSLPSAKKGKGCDAIIYIKCRPIPGFSSFLCWSFTSLSEPHYSLKRASATVTTLKPSCWCVSWCVPVLVWVFFVLFFYHRARNSKTRFVLSASVMAEWDIWRLDLCVFVHSCWIRPFVCWRRGGCSGPWETGGLTRMYGCFKIHLQAFFYCHSPLLSAHNTPHPISKEYTGTRGNPLLAITSTIIAFSPSWQVIRRVPGIQSFHCLSII